MTPESRLTSATRILYKLQGISSQVKFHWNSLLPFLFEGRLTAHQITDMGVAAAAKPLESEEAAVSFFKSWEADDQIWFLGITALLLDYAKVTRDKESERVISNWRIKFGAYVSNENLNKAAEVGNELISSFASFTKRKKLSLQGSILLFTVDFSLRWILLILLEMLGYNKDYIISSNLAVPILVLGIGTFISRRHRRSNQLFLEEMKSPRKFGLLYQYTATQYTLIALYLLISGFTAALVFEDLGNGVIATLGLTVYYYFLLKVLPLGKLNDQTIETQLQGSSSRDKDDADENDERIVLLETQLNSNTGRLEAYVLESALFGALAFSAFLQIFATNLISFADLESFASNVHHAAHGLVLSKSEEFNQAFIGLSSKESLFSLISIETLICSGLFVAVIASRLRFSRVADAMRTDLNLAKAYNEKEERILEAIDAGNKVEERFSRINDRVKQHLHQAEIKFADILPVVRYIVYFRNFGVVVFAGVLITSCLFISNTLAWTFLGVVAATWIYFNKESISEKTSSLSLRFRIYFVRHNYLLLTVAFIPFVLGYFMRIQFGWANTGPLIAFTILLVTLYLSGSLLLPYYDERFGDVESGTTYQTIKNFYAIVVLMAGMGVMMRVRMIHGANPTIIISSLLLHLSSFFIAYYLTRPRWLSLIWGLLLSMSVIGANFKLLHLSGANEMTTVALFSIGLLVIMAIVRRKWFHRLFIRITLVYSLVLFYFSPQIGASYFLSLIYEHSTIHIQPIKALREVIEPRDSEEALLISDEELRRSIDASNQYLAQYPARFGFTSVHGSAIGWYERVAETILANNPDSVQLHRALMAVDQAERIAKVWSDAAFTYDIAIKADILERLGRKEEAIRYYEEIFKTTVSWDMRSQAKEGLERLRSAKKPTE